ncbi:hypothetical protein ACFV0T_20755 [Streptomyces sp. NPDC059582]|uniref:hypothetical protein n=1 Tax=Streptomyces sp. NPDC059582 TaxID=3346875 RepID=UPI0036A2F3C6
MATPGRTRMGWLPESVPAIVLGAAGTLVVGVVCGLVVDTSALVDSGGYLFGAGLLLAVGLYGSTYGIDLKELRADLSGVLAAVTVGVLLKAGLIAGTMLLVFRRPEALVLGVAVAQIDPLSVAALGRDGRMSPRARSLLTAWASFDDPMTVLLTLYLAGYAYTAAGHPGAPEIAGGGGGGYLVGLGLNAALLAAVVLVWWAGRRVAARLPDTVSVRRTRGAVTVLLVLVTVVLAAAGQLMLAVALAGLVVRATVLDRVLGRAVGGAFLAAFGALGLLLAEGVAWWPGFVLGAAAFLAQAVVALGVMPLFIRGLGRGDRIALGLGQQNGITAVLIALTLERDFPGTAATVGPAVITVNVLHGISQTLLARSPGARWPRGRGELRADELRPCRHEPRVADEKSVA